MVLACGQHIARYNGGGGQPGLGCAAPLGKGMRSVALWIAKWSRI